MVKPAWIVGAAIVLGAPGALAQPPATPTAEQADFFEKRVRPVLVARCVNCHGPQLQSAGIRLDTPDFIARGGSKGSPTVVPGDPSRSALIRAVNYNGPVKMPPQGKLSAKEIEALTQWVKQGAPWPVVTATVSHANDAAWLAAARKHWAFQPVTPPPVPTPKRSTWIVNPIDAFIAQQHEARGLTPAPATDRRSLLRRVTYDLIGLPPTPAEVDAFVNDSAPDAYEKAIDRLLASPHYGERWGRYWLDVARYADTRGTAIGGPGRDEERYPFSYTYRDWVVRAFNEDLPYDKFLLYQIAADEISTGEDSRNMAALGFLTLGRRSLNGDPDVIDDRIDVVMRGTQALTIGCARCHDHKFDPVPMQDYYSLYGVFQASSEKTIPLYSATGPLSRSAVQAFEREKAAREARINDYLKERQSVAQAKLRTRMADYLMAASDANDPAAGSDETSSGLKTAIIAQWRGAVSSAAGKGFDPIFGPWNALVRLPFTKFAVKAAPLAEQFARNAAPSQPINPLIAKLFSGPPPTSLQQVAERYARVFSRIPPQAGANAAASGGPEQAIAERLYGPNGLAVVSAQTVESLLNEKERAHLDALRRSVTQLLASPGAPPHALVLEEAKRADDPRVFLRGDPQTPGDAVPRRYVLCLAGEKREPFKPGNGRLEMAQAIIRPDNPLTARVMVNRIWLGHFGQGIVRTPSDFGVRGEAPTHPELLDFLASYFVENGWSIKKLHRLILLSNTYRMSDADDPTNRKIDPDNRSLWRMNRRRLDFEQMRDSLLVAGNTLDEALGGRSVDITRPPYSARRTLYCMVDRSNLPSMYRIFDFANPDAHTADRFVTISPQQSLFLLNSPFVAQQARQLAARSEVTGQPDARGRIAALYRLLYSRLPTEQESAIGERFLKTALVREEQAREARPSPWRYGFGEVDEATKRVKTFTPLPYWTGSVWQAGMFVPDPDFGFLSLDDGGGVPGSDRQHAVIRRWIAPRDGSVAVSGQVKHLSINGDGIRARIISSRSGEVGSWKVYYTFKETSVAAISVKQGDTLDFVVDCGSDDVDDAFRWAPILTLTSLPEAAGGPRKSRFREAGVRWSAQDGFGGPTDEAGRPMTVLEKYAQALLLSNEFAYID